MTDAEVFQFKDVVLSLQRVFPKRMDDIEIQRMTGDYFKALKRFQLPQVQAGAEAWMQRGKYFPKPAEWIDAIPRRPEHAEIASMSAEQAHEYRRAEALRYEDTPCCCASCVGAGVTERPLRFVPDVNHDGSDKKAKLDERSVTVGHWAHGAELARWYEAKAGFYNAYYAAIAKKTMGR